MKNVTWIFTDINASTFNPHPFGHKVSSRMFPLCFPTEVCILPSYTQAIGIIGAPGRIRTPDPLIRSQEVAGVNTCILDKNMTPTPFKIWLLLVMLYKVRNSI